MPAPVGSYPSAHGHSYEPIVLIHCCTDPHSASPDVHSLMSRHSRPLPKKPSLHTHWKVCPCSTHSASSSQTSSQFSSAHAWYSREKADEKITRGGVEMITFEKDIFIYRKQFQKTYKNNRKKVFDLSEKNKNHLPLQCTDSKIRVSWNVSAHLLE